MWNRMKYIKLFEDINKDGYSQSESHGSGYEEIK